jgi:hypothetical protein
VVFDLGRAQRLGFAVRDGEIMLLNLKLSKLGGPLVLDVVDGYVRSRTNGVELSTRPGKVHVSGGATAEFMPGWAREQLMNAQLLAPEADLPLLDLEVIAPGLVRVQGIWMEQNTGVVITPGALAFLRADRQFPVRLMGEGEASILEYMGPVEASVFNV